MTRLKIKKSWAAIIASIAILALMSTVVPAQDPVWKPNTFYAVGARVTFNGITYTCRQAHTSLVTWEPPAVLALWLPVSAGGGGTTDTQSPTVPTNLRVTATTSTTVSLSWTASTDNTGVTGYDVFRNGMPSGVSTGNSFTATGLQPGTSYTFAVRGKDAAGNMSALSAQVSAMTPSAATVDTQLPTVPTNLRVTGVTTTTVALAWTASTDNVGVTGYDVFRNGAPAGTSSTNSFTSTGLQPGTSYTFTVSAKDAANNKSAMSNQVTATTLTDVVGGGGGGKLPRRAIVGYWHNFENGSGFIKLRDVSQAFDVVNLSFGEPGGGTRSNIQFIPDNRTSAAEIQSDVAILKARGQKVLLSIGGANGQVELNTEADKQNFISSVTNIVKQYGLNGIDVDFEGGSVISDAGDTDFRNPKTPKIVNLISALRTLCDSFGPNFILTMAPETFFVQVGFQVYGGAAGAYLPVIHGVRDKLDLLMVQLYNTGTVLGLDGVAYGSGTADFQVALSEMLITGFPIGGNPNLFFPGLREDQVAIGLPSSLQAAGSGFAPPAETQKALNYLIYGKPYGGRYVLRKASGYPNFRGLMTFSINWDRFNNFEFSKNLRPFLNNLP